jgi:hypothetical protein
MYYMSSAGAMSQLMVRYDVLGTEDEESGEIEVVMVSVNGDAEP